MSCSVCRCEPLGNPEDNLQSRLESARARGHSGCIHQAAELLVSLLGHAAVQAREESKSSMSSVVLSSVVLEGDEEPLFEAAFLSNDDAEPFFLRRGKESNNPAQAAVNLLLQIHDEVLMGLKSSSELH